jgi:hypothetical protein
VEQVFAVLGKLVAATKQRTREKGYKETVSTGLLHKNKGFQYFKEKAAEHLATHSGAAYLRELSGSKYTSDLQSWVEDRVTSRNIDLETTFSPSENEYTESSDVSLPEYMQLELIEDAIYAVIHHLERKCHSLSGSRLGRVQGKIEQLRSEDKLDKIIQVCRQRTRGSGSKHTHSMKILDEMLKGIDLYDTAKIKAEAAAKQLRRISIFSKNRSADGASAAPDENDDLNEEGYNSPDP